jgi:asparagine synthase (glutamine-hydrolysing)
VSGIAGLLELEADARPDSLLLDRALAALRQRFPDGGGAWREGPCAFAWAGLDTGAGPPVVLAEGPGGAVVLDGRLDDRARLVEALAAAGQAASAGTPDAGLLLQAYGVWGSDCCEHLLGDFAFALWDRTRRRLLLARDRFGVRPLYYARREGRIAFSGDLRALLEAPWARTGVEASALLDFLLFAHLIGAEATAFEAVRQVPPGHALALEDGATSLWRYASPAPLALPASERPQAIAEQFREVLGAAVADRTREGAAGVLLSGGMDSTAVAALARRGAVAARLRGYTVTCDRLHPGDEEGRYATQAAGFLGFETSLHPGDEVRPFMDWDACASPYLPPVYSPNFSNHRALLRRVADDGVRVLLSGEGGDPTLLAHPGHLRALVQRGHWRSLLAEVVGALRARGSLRQLGLRGLLPGADLRPKFRPDFPDWLRPETVRQHGLRERWEAYWGGEDGPRTRLEHASADLASARQYEGVWTPVEVRYPFLDARVIAFLLALPQCLVVDKWVLREAMAGLLPEPVRRRPKTAFRFDSLRWWLQGPARSDMAGWSFELLDGFVDAAKHREAVARYLDPAARPAPWDGLLLTTPVALEGWLRNAARERLFTP